MNKKLFFSISVGMLCLTSCMTHDFVEPTATIENVENNFKISPKQAESNVMDFIKNVSVSDKSKTRSFAGITIKNTIPLRSHDGVCTRGEESPIDTLMYFVNFDNNAGFAIAAADNRTDPILAIIDEGNYSKEDLLKEDNPGFMAFLEGAISTELDDIENYTPNQETRATEKGWEIKALYPPLLKTIWGQGGWKKPNSFGKYCPNKVTGCVPIALAQILSHYKIVKDFYWDEDGKLMTETMNWDRIIRDCEKYNGKLSYDNTPQSIHEVACLCRHLGKALGAEYYFDYNDPRNNQTSVGSQGLISCLKRFARINATSLKNYNEGAIISAIKQGNPVFAVGCSLKYKTWIFTTGYGGGHAWVYDGSITADRNGRRQNFIHCNWGWNGDGNGYYISKAFTVNKGPEIKDGETTRSTTEGEEDNYQFELQYSIISR